MSEVNSVGTPVPPNKRRRREGISDGSAAAAAAAAAAVPVPAPLVSASAPSVGADKAAAETMIELVKQDVPEAAKEIIQVSDGTYVGQVNQADEPHGKGTLTYLQPNAIRALDYVGQFKNGVAEGEGTIRFQNGGSYTGTVIDGAPHGSGTMTFSSGFTYQGQFKNTKLYEPGTFTLTNSRTVQLTNGKIKLTNGTVLVPNRRQAVKNKGRYYKGSLLGEFEVTTLDNRTIIVTLNPTPFHLLEDVISATLKEQASV